MKYKVKISIKKDTSEKEIQERIKQFQDAFVIAAVDYLTNKENEISIA